MRRLLSLLLLCGVFGIVGCGGGEDVERTEEAPPLPGNPVGMDQSEDQPEQVSPN